MRRAALGLAGAVAIAAAAASFAVSRAPLDGAGDRLIAELQHATGLEVRVNGATAVELFPSPRVRVDGVSLARPGEAPFAAARGLVGRISLSALLLGRIELAEVTFDQPQIALDRAPFANVATALRARTAATPPAIRLADGRLEWRGRVVDKIEAGLALPRDGGPLALSGYGRFADRQVEGMIQLADVGAFARRDSSPFRGRFEGGGARVLFDGEAVDDGAGVRLTGDVSFRADALSSTLRWFGFGPRLDRALGAEVSFAGQGQLDGAGLQISNAELDLGGETFLGAGRLTSGAGGLAVEATLDAGSVDLGPYFDLVAPDALADDGRWSVASLNFGSLRGWTLDLRLSADALRLGGLRLEQPAVTAVVANGGLDLSIGEASAYGGAVGGRLSLEPDGDGAVMRVEGAASDVALGDALEAVFGRKPIAGRMTAEISLEGRGASPVELAAALAGRIEARLADGALERVSRSRTLALAGLTGEIAFSRAEARMTVANGVAKADPVTVEGPRASFALAGEASLIERTVALQGFVKPSEGGWTLPVRVEGPLFAPKLRPDLSGRAPRGEASKLER
ncbi:AsmA family protein [Chenggangzhangella methanolivorans]|uniref:AsmA family protein n=1 Tax=Chenggangzhangella methanolivorans TaxID=1437009 RepID=A0A9E6UKX6_9HYPH|nr:AsmA-like C-terminal region-containing protein [Chenggangzhangella methanolivorans]QZN98365.1 AsmA family protein [Chenggangzhangella methanolivorans]